MRHIGGQAARSTPDSRTSTPHTEALFLVTHLPLFSRAKDTIEADDWLHTTKSKFRLLHFTEYQKTLYAAQQLRGPARA
jgi:hypothetical protein